MDEKPSLRESGNRLVGLSSYAMGVVLLGVIGIGLYDDGLKDLSSLGFIAAGAFICFAIGYTTTRKKL